MQRRAALHPLDLLGGISREGRHDKNPGASAAGWRAIAMPQPKPPAPPNAAPREAMPFARDRAIFADTRFLCDALRLARLCPHVACRRADCCRGEPSRCLDTRGQAAPEEARGFAELLLDAERDGEPIEEIEALYPEDALAWRMWIAALNALPRRA